MLSATTRGRLADHTVVVPIYPARQEPIPGVTGRLVTDGGRVLGVTAVGDTIAQAQKRAYDAMKLTRFDGMHYRRDIGRKAVTS